MVKGIFIEQVLLRVNGGVLNDSSSLKRAEIRKYVPAAINYVLTASYNITLQQEGNRDMSSLFYGYFANQTILKDASRHNWAYIAYPKATIAFANNQGIRGIEDGDGNQFKPLSDNAFRTINQYKDIFTGAKYYRPEQIGIYLFNQGTLTTNVGLTMIVDSDALLDTDVLPLPAGLEGKAIDICVEFFTGQREIPAKKVDDKTDIN